tara:strand:+ start:336 stop:743 length:408 start_codon:yes stop_codon:yes gene_type:complete
MLGWKGNANYYTHTAGYRKNIRPEKNTAFKSQPIRHYRKQYSNSTTMQSTSKYYGNHLTSYTSPGANIVSMWPSQGYCIGLSGIASHTLDNKERDRCYEKCNKIRRGAIEPVSKNKRFDELGSCKLRCQRIIGGV